MPVYKILVTTGDMPFAGTWDSVYVTLVGSEGQSKRTELNNIGFDFSRGKARSYTLKHDFSLGNLLLLTVAKDPFFIFPEDKWYCSKILVTTPEDNTILFPCYRWISRGELVELRGGKATLIYEDELQLLLDHRNNEIQSRKTQYQWTFHYEGLPNGYDDGSKALAEGHASATSTNSFEQSLGGISKSKDKWKSFEEMEKVIGVKKTAITDYVMQNWKDDSFFGFQFLNGVNPNAIKRCSQLPSNFPITNWMLMDCVSAGWTVSQLDGLCLSWMDCVSAGGTVSQLDGLCLSWMDCVSQLDGLCLSAGWTVSQLEELSLSWMDCVSQLDGLSLSWMDCVSAGWTVSQLDGLCLSWRNCLSAGWTVSLSWMDCVSAGWTVSQLDGLCLSWMDCVSQLDGLCLSWMDCVSAGWTVSQLDGLCLSWMDCVSQLDGLCLSWMDCVSAGWTVSLSWMDCVSQLDGLCLSWMDCLSAGWTVSLSWMDCVSAGGTVSLTNLNYETLRNFI
uniref:Uncharacterized protein n=1 Tax=Knipowitschia caucasica TaxID=637954 RepID=A0AAV2KF02_KNICA